MNRGVRLILFLAALFCAVPSFAFAADRYWVGGSGTWDGTAGTKWATTSGGAGGAAVPTSADACFFDVNSTGTVTVGSGNTGCGSLDFTGFTNTFAGSSAITISGDITFVQRPREAT